MDYVYAPRSSSGSIPLPKHMIGICDTAHPSEIPQNPRFAFSSNLEAHCHYVILFVLSSFDHRKKLTPGLDPSAELHQSPILGLRQERDCSSNHNCLDINALAALGYTSEKMMLVRY
jgi:hypothetical protein